jgi:hypothetical protein
MKAWSSAQSGLPEHFRRILDLMRGAPDSAQLCSGMRGHTEEQVQDWLDQLETLGFVESRHVTVAVQAAFARHSFRPPVLPQAA